MPCELPTVTSTHWAKVAFGGTTVMEVADCATMRPGPAEPNVTEEALAKPPPKIVMAPPPLTGPVLGLTAATDGHPSAPCSARVRFGSTGVPRPLAASKPVAAANCPKLVSVKSLLPWVTSVKVSPLPCCAA